MVLPEYEEDFNRLIDEIRTRRAILSFLMGKPDNWASNEEYTLGRENLLKINPNVLCDSSVKELLRKEREWRKKRDVCESKQRDRDRDRKPKKPYIPWSLERKQANQLRLLQEKLRKAFSIPQLYWDALQTELAKNPWRYGVCQIDSDRCSVPPYETWLKKARAIARENELRASGE